MFSLRYEDLVKELFGGQGEEARGDGEQYAKKRKLVGGDTVAVTPARQEYVSDLRLVLCCRLHLASVMDVGVVCGAITN